MYIAQIRKTGCMTGPRSNNIGKLKRVASLRGARLRSHGVARGSHRLHQKRVLVCKKVPEGEQSETMNEINE